MTLAEEDLLIQSACRGDLEAFNRLVLAYQDLVFQHAIWMLGEPQAAEGATQETFLLAYRTLRSFRGGDFGCRLLKIACRLCREELPRREQEHVFHREARDKRGEEKKAVLRGNGPAGAPGQDDLAEIVREGLNELSPGLRSALTLVDLQGMDYRQAAEILGISEGSVKSYLARARRQLGGMPFDRSR